MHCWRRAGWPTLCGNGGCFRSSFPGFHDQRTFQCQQHFEACCSTAALVKPLQSLLQVPSHPDLLQRSRQSSPPRQPTAAVLWNEMLLGQCRTTGQSPALLRASKCNGGKDFNMLGFPFPWVAQQGMSCCVSLPIRNWQVARFHWVDLAGLRAAA